MVSGIFSGCGCQDQTRGGRGRIIFVPNFISEDNIEQAILKRLEERFGYELLNCHTADAEDFSDGSG
jgi:hypothetical protein